MDYKIFPWKCNPSFILKATRKALKEADNWTTLSTEIEDALDNGELEVIAEKLNGIQSSLKILSHVPDFEDRVSWKLSEKNRSKISWSRW